MSRFEILEPESLDEALSLMGREGEDVPVMAGGVALMILLKQRVIRPKRVITLRKIREMREIRDEPGVGVKIGSLVTHRAIEASPVVRNRCPVFAEAEHLVGNVRIRNMGTIGGEICHGDPHSDAAPVLVGLGASVRLVGPGSSGQSRTIPISEFFLDYMETDVKRGELLAELMIPEPPKGVRATYLKHETSTSTDWPALGVAAFVQENGGDDSDVRVVIGSVEAKPKEIAGLNELARGRALGETFFRELGKHAASQVDPLDDTRVSPWYKKQLTEVYTRRALKSIWTAQ